MDRFFYKKYVSLHDIEVLIQNFFANKGEAILSVGDNLGNGVSTSHGTYETKNGVKQDILVLYSNFQCVVYFVNAKDLLKNKTINLSSQYKSLILDNTDKRDVGDYFKYRTELNSRIAESVNADISIGEDRFSY